MILKLDRNKLLSWLYESETDYAELGRLAVATLIDSDLFVLSDDTFKQMVSYVKFDHVRNLDEVKKELHNFELEQEEIEDVERFEIEWV